MLEFHQTSHLLGHSTLEVICYVVIWALQLLIIQRGMETVRRFQDWAGPAVWVMMLILAVYLVIKAGGIAFNGDIPMDVLLEKTKDAGVPGLPGSFEALAAAVNRRRAAPATVVPALDRVAPAVAALAAPGDLVITLGAGSIGGVADRIVHELERRHGAEALS